jgi:hypothetical protein
MVIVELNETEIAFCYQVASTRRMLNRGFGVKDATLKKDFMSGEALGVIGEYAVGKVLNVFPRFIDRVKGGGEDLIYKNHRIDVKATGNASNGIFVHKPNLDIDIFILAVVDLPKIQILGWAEYKIVVSEENKNKDGGYRYTGKLNTHKIDWKSDGN